MNQLTDTGDSEPAAARLYGFMRGFAVVPKKVDMTEPVLDAPFDAEHGVLHQ